MATAAKFVQPIPIFFGLSRSTRCGCCSYQDSSISAMIIFVFFIFLAFWQFPWQRQPFWKNQPLKAQLHMAYDIPTRFHKVSSRHLREMWKTNFWQKKERKKERKKKKNNNKIWYDLKDHNMVPNSKNDDDYQFARTKATWKANFAQIGGFLYFGGHFEFKMAAIAN